MSYVVLVVLLAQAGIGLKMLLDWRRQSPIAPTAFLHAGIADLTLILWIVYLVADRTWIAWLAFIVILLGNFIGDLLLIGHWRSRTGQGSSFFKDYGAAAMSVVRGQHPRVPTVHAAGAGIVTVLMLIGAIVG